MSTKITDVFTNLRQLLKDTFPDHRRLEYHDDLERCSQPFLRLGYSLAVQPGQDSPRTLCPVYFQRRQFEVTLTREVLAKDGDPESRDAAMMEILEDLHLLRGALALDPSLGGSCVSAQYVNDPGPEIAFINDKPIATVDAQIIVEYEQQVQLEE